MLLSGFYAVSFSYLFSIVKGYNKDFKKISDMMEIVKEGKELPELQDLKTWELKEKSKEKNKK